MPPPKRPTPQPDKTAKRTTKTTASSKRRPAKKTAAKRPRRPRGDGEPLPDYQARPDPWERRDGESAPAWEAFTLYRDMGLSRSAGKVAEECGKNRSLIERWSRAHQWVIRVGAYDAHEDRAFRAEIAEARQKAIRDQADIGNAALVKFGDALENMSAYASLELIRPGDWVRIAEIGLKLQTAALAQLAQPAATGSNGKPGGTDKTPHAVELGKLSDEDRLARFKMLRRELDGRIAEREGHPLPTDEDDDDDE